MTAEGLELGHSWSPVCRVTVSRGVCEHSFGLQLREMGACTCPWMRQPQSPARSSPRRGCAVLCPAALAMALGWRRGARVAVADGPVTAMWYARGGDRRCDLTGAACMWDPPCRDAPSRGALCRDLPLRGAPFGALRASLLHALTAAMCPPPVPTAAPSPRVGHAPFRSQWASRTRAPPPLAPQPLY